MRADQLIVQRGLAPSRSAAQRLIEHGAVRWLGSEGWAAPKKAGEDLPDSCELEVTDDAELRYVSRGGLKLEAALRHTRLDVRGALCLDIGQSTGGFTDCLLQHGAARVVGVDVGHAQLHARLRADARVTCIEGVNARALTPAQLAAHLPAGGADVLVGDLSFISLTLVLPAIALFTLGSCQVLLLVKPQFELDARALGKGGVVTEPAHYARVQARIQDACAANGLRVVDYFDSPITGGDGNREFFVHAVAA